MPATVADAHQHFLQGRQSAAEAICRNILSARRNDPAALQLLAMMAQSQGRLPVALKLAQMALAGGPDVAAFHNTLGAVLGDLRRWDEAAAAFDAALRLQPDYADAWRHLGIAFHKLGRLDDAAHALGRAVDLRPEDDQTWGMLAEVHHSGLNAPAMIACRRRVAELRPDLPFRHSELLYAMHYDAGVSPEQLLVEHKAWAERFAEPLRATWRPHENDPDPDRRLRVGYVSAGFRNHPVTRFQEAEMAARDRSAYELICYASVSKPDAATARLQSLADGWRDVSAISDEQLAEQIRADKIDVLIDLDGHDTGNRLLALARKPAPVQATMNGYLNGTGMSAMDWRITDEWHDPPGMTEHHYVERLCRLPGGVWCYAPDSPGGATAQAGSPHHKLEMQAGSLHHNLPAERNGFITFGSLNRLIKTSDSCLRLWARVLAAVPNSRLLLATPGGAECHAHLLKVLAGQGLDPARIDLLPRSPTRAEYLARLTQVDIALDPFPFNGITTTSDALWLGVPVVSLVGSTFASRAGVSLLNLVGEPNLLAASKEEYVAIATRLAADRVTRAGVRERLWRSRNVGPLFDGKRLAAKLAKVYRAMWQGWCRESGVK